MVISVSIAMQAVGVMGLNKWNHPTVENGGQYMQNGIFVDAFWNQASDEVTQDFVTRFTRLGKAPNIINANYTMLFKSEHKCSEVLRSLVFPSSTLHATTTFSKWSPALRFGDEQTCNEICISSLSSWIVWNYGNQRRTKGKCRELSHPKGNYHDRTRDH